MDTEELKKIINFVSKFGFKFYGFSEDKQVLLTAPNGQITTLTIALQFIKVKKSEISSSTSKGSGPEVVSNLPLIMPESLVTEKIIEHAADAKIEKSLDVANKIEKDSENQNAKVSIVTEDKKTAKKPDITSKMAMPISVGFLPSNFDPLDPKSVTSFIKTHSNSKSTDSKKWLATLWNKFLIEQGYKDN